MESNTQLKQNLVAQRSTELAAAQAEHNNLMTLQQGQVHKAASQLATYGGVAEYVTAALLLLLALFERASYENNRTKEKGAPQLKTGEIPFIKNPAQAFSENERKGIGFSAIKTRETTAETMPETKPLKQAETLVITAFQPETKVLVSTETKTDIEREVSEQIRRIQRYQYKLNNGIGTAETASTNIGDALRIITELMKDGPISDDLNQKVNTFKNKYQP